MGDEFRGGVERNRVAIDHHRLPEHALTASAMVVQGPCRLIPAFTVTEKIALDLDLKVT